MRDARLIAVAAAGLALAGCAKSVCDKTADAFNTFRSNAIPCGAKGGVGSTLPSFKIGDACAVVENQCTGADETVMQTYADCIGAIQKCEVGKEKDFLAAEPVCLEKVFPTGLSPNCADAVTDNICQKLGDEETAFAKVTTGCATDLPARKPFNDCVAGSTTQCTWDDRVYSMEAYAACLQAMPQCSDDATIFAGKVGDCLSQLYIVDPCLSGIFDIPAKYLPTQLCATASDALAALPTRTLACPTVDVKAALTITDTDGATLVDGNLVTDDLGCADPALGGCCSDNVSGNCTWTDRIGLNVYALCLNAVPACEAGKEQDFKDAVQACVNGLGGVGCSSALAPQ